MIISNLLLIVWECIIVMEISIKSFSYPELVEDENTPLLELQAEPPDPDCDIPEPEEGGVDKSGGGSRKDSRSSASTSSSYNKNN